jgi:hypothetical protein
MIKFKANFEVYNGEHTGIPKKKRHGENFWCSFNTSKQLIMCNVIYLGDDEFMLQHKIYSGIVELPYGEKFHPWDDEFPETIDIGNHYFLNCAADIVGECELIENLEIINDDFAITKDVDGNY